MEPIAVLISRQPDGPDFLEALEFGRVIDGQPDEYFDFLSDHFRFCFDEPGGHVVGFQVLGLGEFNIDASEHAGIWSGPRFHAPSLGLTDASAGEVVLAARAELLERHTLNRALFRQAIAAEGNQAADLWLACLESGDMAAHFGLGYTLLGLGETRRAYRHLRRYTELVPMNSWAWCWLGQAAAALGDAAEARAHYERAIALAEEGSHETNAPDLLAGLPG